MKKIFISGLILLATGGFASAQMQGDESYFSNTNQNQQVVTPQGQPVGSSGGVRDLKSLIGFIIRYINEGIWLLMALATIIFVWNVVQYFVVKTDGDRSEAAKYLLFSIIGLAVIVSFWGLVNVVIKTFDLENQRPDIKKLYF